MVRIAKTDVLVLDDFGITPLIVDRLVRDAHHLKLRGDSMRKQRTRLAGQEDSGN